MRIPFTLFSLGTATVLACAPSDRDASTDSGRGAIAHGGDSVRVPIAKPRPLPSVSPHPIEWSASRVAERLRGAGLAPIVMTDSVTEPFLQPPGTRIIVRVGPDSAEVLLFVYRDASAAGRDAATLDTVRVAPRTAQVTWRAPAQLVTDNNLLAIVLSESAALRARVAGVLVSREPRVH